MDYRWPAGLACCSSEFISFRPKFRVFILTTIRLFLCVLFLILPKFYFSSSSPGLVIQFELVLSTYNPGQHCVTTTPLFTILTAPFMYNILPCQRNLKVSYIIYSGTRRLLTMSRKNSFQSVIKKWWVDNKRN